MLKVTVVVKIGKQISSGFNPNYCESRMNKLKMVKAS